MRIPSPTEHQEQAAVCQWLSLQYPDVLFFSVPNGVRYGGSKQQRFGMSNKLRAEGMLPGAPDLVILAPRGAFHACLLEMKRVKGGKVSEEQRDFLVRATLAGYYTIVGIGFDDAVQKLTEYLSLKIWKSDELRKYRI